MVLIASIVIMIAGIVFYDFLYERDFEWLSAVLSTIGGICGGITLIATVVLAIDVSALVVIDEKISMYEEENAIIENQIAETVKQYQAYEQGVFEAVSPESAVTLVSLYPELKADTLVQKQIEAYVENNQKIKALKGEKISGSVKRWWLYFGK